VANGLVERKRAGRSLAAPAALALCLALTACGGSAGTSAGIPTASSKAHHRDRDNDNDNNDDDSGVLDFGNAADPSERRAIAAIVTRYYADAAAENGAQACALLVPLQAESVTEQDGQSPALRGHTCPVVMSKLFKLHHAVIAGKAAAMKIIAVRILGNLGLVVIEFPEIYEARQIGVRRIAGRWMVFDLLDGIME
jgi:hypothetical protein